MRYLLSTLLIALPVAAHAEPIPDAALEQSFGQCVNRCEEVHGYGMCAEMCGCMTGEMSRYWDMEEFRARAQSLRDDPDDRNVGAELTRLAEYCARRAD